MTITKNVWIRGHWDFNGFFPKYIFGHYKEIKLYFNKR